MFSLRPQKKLVERPKNDPKANLNNPVDRKIILTLALTALVVLVLIVVAVVLYYSI